MNREKEIKLSIFPKDMIVSIEYLKEYVDELLETQTPKANIFL